MAKTKKQLRELCQRRTKTEGEGLVATGFDEDLNIAQQEVAQFLAPIQRDDTKDLLLTNGTETYDLDLTVDDVTQVRITSPVDKEREIPFIRRSELRKLDPVTSNTAKTTPSRWYWSEPTIDSNKNETKRISFWPIPEQDYTVTYSFKRKVTDMVDEDDVPFFLGKFHHYLCDYAIWQYAEQEPDETMNPVYWATKWENDKDKIYAFYDRNRYIEQIPGVDRIAGA